MHVNIVQFTELRSFVKVFDDRRNRIAVLGGQGPNRISSNVQQHIAAARLARFSNFDQPFIGSLRRKAVIFRQLPAGGRVLRWWSMIFGSTAC